MVASNAAQRVDDMMDAACDAPPLVRTRFAQWRERARALIERGTVPANAARAFDALDERPVLDAEGPAQGALFADAAQTPDTASGGAPRRRVPREFGAFAAAVACHSDHDRWALLYRVAWRLVHEEPHLLDIASDVDVYRLDAMRRAVKRDVHKMHAFVRFRRLRDDGTDATAAERYVAWFEPGHDIVERATPFFVRRFPAMRWSILTPLRSAHWDGARLAFGGGAHRADAPDGDELEELWREYYASTFNPARLSIATMRAEMPRRYWRNLPEATLIAPLARGAAGRVRAMVEEARRAGLVGDDSVPAHRGVRGTFPVGGPPHFTIAPTLLGARASALGEASGERTRAHVRSGLTTDAAHPRVYAATGPSHALAAMTRASTPILVGTASWTDPTLTAPGVWYPDDANTAERRLAFYASRFPFVEIDSTYYALPTRRVAELWVARTPPAFMFDVKAHAILTGHPVEPARLPRALRELLPTRLAGRNRIDAATLPDEVIDAAWRCFLDALAPLAQAEKLGAILLQMPRSFAPARASVRVLERMRARLGDTLGAIEFRHGAWFTPRLRARTLALLERLGFAHVMVDGPQGFTSSVPRFPAVTSPRLAVLRLHGRRRETWETPVSVVSERYRWRYDRESLGEWVPWMIDVAKQVQGVHIVFNNCHADYGTTDAGEISEMLIEADEERRRMYREHRRATVVR